MDKNKELYVLVIIAFITFLIQIIFICMNSNDIYKLKQENYKQEQKIKQLETNCALYKYNLEQLKEMEER